MIKTAICRAAVLLILIAVPPVFSTAKEAAYDPLAVAAQHLPKPLDLTVKDAARQREILDQARRLMKPGGRMVYATCSLENEENQNVVQALRLRAETHLRLPGRDPGDGFFAAVITLV